jgi:hypothetical protein
MLGLIFLLIQYDKRRATLGSGSTSLSHIFRRRFDSDDEDDDDDTESDADSMASPMVAHDTDSDSGLSPTKCSTRQSIDTEEECNVPSTRDATSPAVSPRPDQDEPEQVDDNLNNDADVNVQTDATTEQQQQDQQQQEQASTSPVAAVVPEASDLCHTEITVTSCGDSALEFSEEATPVPEITIDHSSEFADGSISVSSEISASISEDDSSLRAPEVAATTSEPSFEELLAREAEQALRQAEKRAIKRRAIAEEMVSTERSYVQGLQTLIEVYSPDTHATFSLLSLLSV